MAGALALAATAVADVLSATVRFDDSVASIYDEEANAHDGSATPRHCNAAD